VEVTLCVPPGIRTQNLRIKSVLSEFPTLVSLHRKWFLPAVMFPGLISRIQDSPGFVAQDVAQNRAHGQPGSSAHSVTVGCCLRVHGSIRAAKVRTTGGSGRFAVARNMDTAWGAEHRRSTSRGCGRGLAEVSPLLGPAERGPPIPCHGVRGRHLGGTLRSRRGQWDHRR